ncbi:hypothetical protein R1sor_025224 [Riccia sorocarpa]|uniref:Uncharacterized protein n=1 Tax=Riccia sorocarpa TaxID=122646 RepID=A0ABD3G9D2_9MARC
MDYTDLNARSNDDSGYSSLPDFGPPGGYLKRIFNPREVPTSAIGMRDWGCSELDVLVRFYGDNKVMESGRTMQALVSPTSVKGTDLSEADPVFMKALELWKGATTHRFLYSNPTTHLSGFQVFDFAGRLADSVPEVCELEQAAETQENTDL